jgi:hypothetical protein
MRLILSLEKPCECGEPATVRQPKNDGTGRYESFCLDCLSGTDRETRLEELLALLDSIPID